MRRCLKAIVARPWKVFAIVAGALLFAVLVVGVRRNLLTWKYWGRLSEELEQQFEVEVVGVNLLNYSLQIELNGEYRYNYHCWYNTRGQKLCASEFADGTTDYGVYFTNVFREQILGLMEKYRISKVKHIESEYYIAYDEEELVKFFQEVLAIPDMRRIYELYKSTGKTIFGRTEILIEINEEREYYRMFDLMREMGF